MSEPISGVMWLKLAGAAMGSSIAVVFKPGGDTWMRLFQRFVIGVIIGFIFSPILLDYLELKHSADYWLASATFCGLMGYLLLQMLFSERTQTAIRGYAGKAKGK